MRFLVVQGVVWTLLASLPWLVLVVYPGVLEPTGAVLCPDDQQETRMVEYHTTSSDGNGTSYTLVCVGPDGDLTEAGSWAPLALFFLGVIVAVQAVVLPLQLLGFLRRRRRGPPTGPPRPIRTPGFITIERGRGW